MSERSILFSASMVRAILGGRKAQTRRIVKDVPTHWEFLRLGNPCATFHHPGFAGEGHAINRYGQPGDRLWVRETWRAIYDYDLGNAIEYRADDLRCNTRAPDETIEPHIGHQDWRWRPSIHMPRWASRITLEITGVRVERLQDISEENAMAEGAEPVLVPPDGGSCPHREGFRELWQSINGPGSWEQNPWVWVVEFNRLKQAEAA